MQLVLLLHRVTNIVVYDLESTRAPAGGMELVGVPCSVHTLDQRAARAEPAGRAERHEPPGGLVTGQDARSGRADRPLGRRATTPGRSCCR